MINQTIEFSFDKAYEMYYLAVVKRLALRYYYDQADYDKYHVSEDNGSYGIAISNALKIKRALKEDGFEVQINYPG